MDKTREIELLMDCDVDELYALIVDYSTEYEGHLFSIEEKTETGRSIFSSIALKLEHAICDEWDACGKIAELGRDEVALAAALMDVITTAAVGIPATVLSVLVVRIGLRRFCHCE